MIRPLERQLVGDRDAVNTHAATSTRRDLIILLALTLVLHLPFVGQAFHLDDIQYLELAQNVYRSPLFPMDLPSVFEGRHLSFWGHTHPPLNGYLIAALLLLHGGSPSEVLLHGAFMIFPVMAAVSFYFLARRFVAHPLLASALLATNPTLVVCAHTLMADVPLLALWLCATVLFIWGLDTDNRKLLGAAALPLTAACFYAYQALALIPLLVLYAVCRRRLRWHVAAVLFVPFMLMAVWQFSGYLHRGMIYAATMFGYLEVRGIMQGSTKTRTAIATLTYLGGTILPFPLVFWRFGRQWRGGLLAAAVAAALAVSALRFPEYPLAQKSFFIGCFAGGLVAFIRVAVRACAVFRAKLLSGVGLTEAFLCSWFLGMVTASVVAFFSGSARYLLPACPPLLLLLIRWDEEAFGSLFRKRGFYVALLATQLALSFYLARSDYEFADVGRREAREFQAKYLSTNEPFLFSAEWGLRHYLSSLGGTIMAEDTTGARGQLVVKSRLALGQTFDNALDRSLEPVEERVYRIRSPIRLLDEQSHAGFWSDGWGVLPFWFSRDNLDELTIYRVSETP
jgi:hypothetical protein